MLHHGILDVFAFQEALLIEVAFGIALLTMIWIGFRRWLRHKDEIDRRSAEQTAELAAQHSDQMDRVEARLNAIEQYVTHGEAAPIGKQPARWPPGADEGSPRP